MTKEELEQVRAYVRGGDTVTFSGLARAGSALLDEVDALVADNAALADMLRLILEHPSPDSEAQGYSLIEKHHPGAALLSEMEAMRKRVAELEEDKAHWDEREATLKAEADHLRGVIVGRTDERDEARAALAAKTAVALQYETDLRRAEATARAAALEEAAQRMEKWHGLRDDMEDYGPASDRAASAIRALDTTPSPPVVPVAKVREVLRKERDEARAGAYWSRDRAEMDDACIAAGAWKMLEHVAETLGINLDGEA